MKRERSVPLPAVMQARDGLYTAAEPPAADPVIVPPRRAKKPYDLTEDSADAVLSVFEWAAGIRDTPQSGMSCPISFVLLDLLSKSC